MGKRSSQAEFFPSDVGSPRAVLSDRQKLCWLRLIRTPNIGPATFRDLINYFGGAENALDALSGGHVKLGTKNICSKDEAEREIEAGLQYGAQLVARGESAYPSWLQQIDDAPPLLFVKGKLELLGEKIVSVVGSRNASAAGAKFSSMIAKALGDHGFVVASGLARGIDAHAHGASLASGTIGVLGGGLDHIYPPQNEELYQKIASNGVLVSERPMGYLARGKDFPRRNRIISGMAIGTVVVEAAQRSGSLSTARFALEQGRDVFAVPGNPLDPRAMGTNKLIQDGAVLVNSPRDIIDYYANDLSFRSRSVDNSRYIPRTPFLPTRDTSSEKGETNLISSHGLNASEFMERLVELLGPAPIEQDELCRQLSCSSSEVQIALIELDLEGRLERHGGQLISLRLHN